MTVYQSAYSDSPSHDQLSLVELIKDAFESAGCGNVYTEFTSGKNKLLVYSIPLTSSELYGSAYLQVKITDGLAVTQQLFAEWDSSKKIGISGGRESTSVTFSKTANLQVRTFRKEGEFRLIALSQTDKFALLGYLRPSDKHPAFDETTGQYIFQSNNTWKLPFVAWNSSGATFYQTSDYTSNMGNINLSKAHPVTNKRDLVAGMLLYANSGYGIVGKTSEDIVSVAAAGLNKFDIIQDASANNEYVLLYPGNGCMAIRVDQTVDFYEQQNS